MNLEEKLTELNKDLDMKLSELLQRIVLEEMLYSRNYTINVDSEITINITHDE